MQKTITKLDNKVSLQISIPGDKSISHRSVIFGSIIPGKTKITNFLQGEDCKHTLEAFKVMGVEAQLSDNVLEIQGRNLANLKAPSKEIYLGNSGTSIRLLSGLFAGLNFSTILTGDESLQKRPMKRVIEPLTLMGAKIDSLTGGLAPLKIHAVEKLKAINFESPIASAQVKSCLLLASFSAEGEMVISEPHLSRDHTERMLEYLGANLNKQGNSIIINGQKAYNELKAKDIFVPGDISSAAFFMVAAAILEKAEITVLNVGLNPSRIGVLEAFDMMNIDYKILNKRSVNNEPIADIKVKSSQIKSCELSGDLIPRLIDEIPILAILAAQAQGTTVIKDAEELRVKESNRIATTLNMLKALGVKAQETQDGLIIEGLNKKPFSTNSGSFIDSHGDHRLAMSSSIAALYSTQPVTIDKVEFVQTSFPNFYELLEKLKNAN